MPKKILLILNDARKFHVIIFLDQNIFLVGSFKVGEFIQKPLLVFSSRLSV